MKLADAIFLVFAVCAHGLPVRSAEPQAFAVKFVDADSSVIWTDRVAEGACACPPSDPVKFGYDFAGWSDGTSVKSYAEIDRLPVAAAKTWTATYAKHAGRRLRVGVYSGPGANGGSALNVHRLFGSNPRIEYVSVQTNRVQEGAFMDRLDMFLIPGGTTKLMYGQLGKSTLRNRSTTSARMRRPTRCADTSAHSSWGRTFRPSRSAIRTSRFTPTAGRRRTS